MNIDEEAYLQAVIRYTLSHRKYKKILFKNMFFNYCLVFSVFLTFCYSLWIHSSIWVIAIISSIILFLLHSISFVVDTPKEMIRKMMLSKKGIKLVDKFLKNAPSGTFITDEIHEFYNLIDEDELTK